MVELNGEVSNAHTKLESAMADQGERYIYQIFPHVIVDGTPSSSSGSDSDPSEASTAASQAPLAVPQAPPALPHTPSAPRPVSPHLDTLSLVLRM
ncbi:hypothetical protein E3N88_20184 [Mikania micrantha]|uniref:Uncharacterized protein n=1 Tax=Mikania micrantha TaxID=192012 RepID=A0A5N6NGA3_9ASTR|nr:hypothetical protein E3N88_20184 [Mikania micrantha]